MSQKHYLVSTGDVDETFGLYVVAGEGQPHPLLAYFHDHDSFVQLKPGDRARFVSPSSIDLCKDEAGNEYRGEKLARRIQEAIRAYEEWLPEFLKQYPTMD